MMDETHDLERKPLCVCAVIGYRGPEARPLACTYEAGHEGPHAWAWLPKFALTFSTATASAYPSVGLKLGDFGAHLTSTKERETG